MASYRVLRVITALVVTQILAGALARYPGTPSTYPYNSSVLLEASACNTHTNQKCNWWACSASLGSTTCVDDNGDKECICNPGFCLADNNVCTEAKLIPACQIDTGGVCKWLGCNSWRGNTSCINDRCICEPGFCTSMGMCVSPLPGPGPAPSPACVRFTGSACSISGVCWPPYNVDCERNEGLMKLGSCMCLSGTCLFQGYCLWPNVITFILNYSWAAQPIAGLLGFGVFFWCIGVPILASACLVYKLGACVGEQCHNVFKSCKNLVSTNGVPHGGLQEPFLNTS